MRSVSEYSTWILDSATQPPGSVARRAFMQAGGRAATRSGASAVVSRVFDEILASGGHDDLLLGAVDPVSWERREAFLQAVTGRLEAMVSHPSEQLGLIHDHVALEAEARFPALDDRFQAIVESFERDWGFGRSLIGDLALPGVRSRSATILGLSRQSRWSAARVAGGRPTGLAPGADSRAHRLPSDIEVRLSEGLPIVRLLVGRPTASVADGWAQIWFAVQDRTRLIPFDSALAAPSLIDPDFLPALTEVAVGAISWHDTLVRRFRSVFTAAYQRDGMPEPGWRREVP